MWSEFHPVVNLVFCIFLAFHTFPVRQLALRRSFQFQRGRVLLFFFHSARSQGICPVLELSNFLNLRFFHSHAVSMRASITTWPYMRTGRLKKAENSEIEEWLISTHHDIVLKHTAVFEKVFKTGTPWVGLVSSIFCVSCSHNSWVWMNKYSYYLSLFQIFIAL